MSTQARTAEAESEVVAFDDPFVPGVDLPALLGGKGAGLVEMTQTLGLPVPPGFVITTNVCRRYLAAGWPDRLEDEIDGQLARLAVRTGRSFGDPAAPLLVSVRSGAPVSMPGMMDTLLNVGITPAICDRLAAESGDPLFAADTWLRFCRMYAEIVLGLGGPTLDAAARGDRTAAGARAAADRICALAWEHAPPGIPEAPKAQLRGAIEAVFRSWNSDRARVFRAREGIAEDLGTAVTVQAMVFGNLDDQSGTGVVFTRCPSTGDPEPFGDYLPRAQGEDVVAGTHAVSGLDALQRQLPAVYAALVTILQRLERHYRDLCDVEFTVSAGQLYLLQTRIGRRSPLAAARIAVAMAEDPDFPLTRAEAVQRVDAHMLRHLSEAAAIDPTAVPVATGRPASPGIGVGVLCCDPDRAAALTAAGEAVVLAREDTSPSDVHGMAGAAGIVTTTGGVASHAAVVARGWAIPAVTSLGGTEVVAGGLNVGGLFIAEGETVTVDGGAGALYRGDCRAGGVGEIEEVRALRRWAAELGVEPGAAEEPAEEPQRDRDVSAFQLLRTVQLKGLCTAERAAAVLMAALPAVESLLAANEGMFRATPRGLALSPAGRAWLTERLAEERQSADQAAFESCYERFLALNARLKRLVSEWQVASADGYSAEAYRAMADSLAELDGSLRPLVAETAALLPRLDEYAARFESALRHVQGGDVSMLASPLKDSYHTVWFEYHEELITVCGRDRLAEERAEGG
ncbi:MAG: pyruvate, phosphate dikinase [Chloroflexi bacterium]|nr:pyruvate, phosphate dikinase [Chloroflexota bacterium]